MRARARATAFAPLLVPLLVAAMVLAIFGLVRGGGGSSGPPPLRLTGGGGGGGDAATLAGGAPALFPVRGPLRLAAKLSSDRPADGAVYRLAAAAPNDGVVRRLAEALGLGAPAAQDGGWVAKGDHGALRVENAAGQPWTYGPGECLVADPDAAVSSPEKAAVAVGRLGCVSGGTVASGGGGSAEPAPMPVPSPPTGPPPPPPAPDAKARQGAAPVLAAVGLDGDGVATTVSHGVVTADPVLDGLRTEGWTTTVAVTRDGVEFANGWLGTATPERTYPLVSAKGAYARLRSGPQPAAAELCLPPKDRATGCAKPAERVVTGAELGLLLSGDEDGPLLVPAWLFTVRDDPNPVPSVAIRDDYLVPAEHLSGDGGAGRSGSSGSVQVVRPPAPGVGPSPAPPPDPTRSPYAKPAPAGGAVVVRVDRWTAVGDLLVLGYGESGSCPVRNPRPYVREDDKAVTVAVLGDAFPAGMACTDDYRYTDIKALLRAPLGDRLVVDLMTGDALLYR